MEPILPGTRSIGSLNIYFAFSGSILGAFSMAATTKTIIHVEAIKYSVFAGIIHIGIIGNFIIDHFVAILIGFTSGSFSNLFFNVFYSKLKNKNFLEANAIIFVFLFSSILGAFLIAPVIIQAYKSLDRYSTIS